MADENVEELESFVNRRNPEELAKTGNVTGNVATSARQMWIRIDFHRPEFQTDEGFAISANPVSVEEWMSFSNDCVNWNDPPPEQRKTKDDSDKRSEYINQTFERKVDLLAIP